MYRILFVFFIVFPILELLLIVHVGSIIGAWTTLFLLVTNAVIGITLARYAGIRTLVTVQKRLARKEPLSKDLLDGAMLLLAGLLLLLPGFMTDIVALLLILPISRTLLRRGFLAMVRAYLRPANTVQPDVVEGEFRREENSTPLLEHPSSQPTKTSTTRKDR